METIIIDLVLQGTPTNVNEVARFSAAEYLIRSFPVIPFNRDQ